MSREKRYEFARRLTISAADVNTGEFVEFTQDNTSFFDMALAALSSSSVPIIWPPQDFKGHLLMDGGTIWDVNIASAIKQCNAMGASNEEITVDIAVCLLNKSTHGGPVVNSIEAYIRAKAIHWYYGGMNSITAEERGSPGVNFRYYFQERFNTCDNKPLHILDFDGDTTWCLQEAGRQDAKNALNMGQEHIHMAMGEWFDNKFIQK